jgi:predicted HTH transcriptional regulator
MVGSYLRLEQRVRATAEEAVRQRAPTLPVATTNASPGVAELLLTGENDQIEFKSTLRKNLHTNKNDEAIEHAVLKTIAAFLNSAGGSLVIGVNDLGEPLGLEADAFASEDRMALHLASLIRDRIGAQHSGCIRARFEEVEGKRVMTVQCSRASEAVYVRDKAGEHFFVRLLGSTMELQPSQIAPFLAQRHITEA